MLPFFSASSRPLLFRAFPFQTCFLSSACPSGSDYSAFCSSFPFLPVSASQGLPQCSSSGFPSYVFPVLSRLVSRAFLPGFGTQLPVCFLSPFLASLPTAVPRVLPFCFRFRAFPLPFQFLSSPSVPPPATWPSVSSFPFFPLLPLSGLIGAASPLSLPCFPRSVPAGFPSVLSRFPYSAFCLFPFILPGFAPTAADTGASLLFRFRFSSGLFCSPSTFFRLLLLASDYSAFCAFFSPLPDLPWQRFNRCATVSFVPVAFPFCPACFHAFLPVPVLSFLHFLSTFSGFASQWLPPVVIVPISLPDASPWLSL